jgi:hypothetical protein
MEEREKTVGETAYDLLGMVFTPEIKSLMMSTVAGEFELPDGKLITKADYAERLDRSYDLVRQIAKDVDLVDKNRTLYNERMKSRLREITETYIPLMNGRMDPMQLQMVKTLLDNAIKSIDNQGQDEDQGHKA